MKSYEEITRYISKHVGEFRKDQPDVMQGFYEMSNAAIKGEGVLDEKTRELIAMAIGVAARCEGCIGFHAKALVKLGCTREEFTELLGVAVYMGGGPSLMYAAEAIKAYDEFSA